jgi:hypothetical protein
MARETPDPGQGESCRFCCCVFHKHREPDDVVGAVCVVAQASCASASPSEPKHVVAISMPGFCSWRRAKGAVALSLLVWMLTSSRYLIEDEGGPVRREKPGGVSATVAVQVEAMAAARQVR